MSKRFTDTDKWKKPFIRGLEAKYKLLWFYLLDDCDHAGIWIVDIEIASIRCGFEYSEKEVLRVFKNHIQVVKGGKYWFIEDFVDFQYGELNPHNRAHASVIGKLNKYKIKPLTSPLYGAKDKDKDKDKDKYKEKDIPTFNEFYEYGVKYRNVDKEELRLKYASWVANDWRDGNDNPIKNWKTKLLNTIKFLKLAESTKTRIAL